MSASSVHRLVARAVRQTLHNLQGFAVHDEREGGDLRHVDPDRTPLNRNCVDPDTGEPVGSGAPAQDVLDVIHIIALENLNARIEGTRKTRGKKEAARVAKLGPQVPWDPKNTKPWTELILTASPDYFRNEGQGPGEWNEEKVLAFEAQAVRSLKTRFGDGLVSMRLHLDEETPHIHAAILPLVETRSKRSGLQRKSSHRSHPVFHMKDCPKDVLKGLTGPARTEARKRWEAQQEKSYERLQTDLADEFAHLGIVRGQRTAEEKRNKAMIDGLIPEPLNDHKTTAEWRAEQAAMRETLQAQSEFATTQNVELLKATEAAKAQEHAATERETAAATREQSTAQQEAISAAEKRGIEALYAEELAYAPADDDRNERLVWGVNAPKKDAEQQALAQEIKPAYPKVLAFGQRLWNLAQRAVEKAKRKAEEALKRREETLTKRAQDLAQQSETLTARENALDARDEDLRTRETHTERTETQTLRNAEQASALLTAAHQTAQAKEANTLIARIRNRQKRHRK